MIDRRTFLMAAPAALLVARPAAAKVPLDRLSAYFNGIGTLQASFTQFNDDGSRSTGTLYMRRPGRARFEYDPPEKSLVLASGGRVAIFDGRSNDPTPDSYPLNKTPLDIILSRNVDLKRANMVVGHSGSATSTTLVVQDPDAPENGRAELVFQNDPLSLAGWVVVDGAGTRTKVQLTRIRLGGSLPNRMFSVQNEISSRK